ncbi:TPA: helix-hairpin-helix domain-containing protein [Providencia stuartii]|uniref:ComEA family DNA-binding protein n=1 Tax=Providencia stuartii TaxID=588 RepID=UPI000E318C4F|nr:helix-hairpin-helix domain-containing protein [Providencia stuartii]AXO18585.1 helix-hairpin-helix domain-containing protein [Providencia stuartii]MBN5592323.1 helix-hairpin-helix domain-containing protein [Providencia stuartii]HEM6905730.1 helix-hairpin-helix domain-containing protein [Providencia stuartii]HEM7154829.1 helix-hairpin-helix domain-containing protein [Providencia stuartii]HEM7522065.1 helix-hairpin-helix domain-containing protein [Providencia stuartii]
MTWMKFIKQSLGSAAVILTILMCSQSALAKKAEADKSVAAVVSKKPKEEKPSENLKETNQVNINQASAEELAKKLHGIGIQKAKAIVEYREKYGAFNTLENILEVRGIGPAFLEKNRGKLAL